MAAFLTILGYSIYDTIIIFDRVRENMPLMRRSPFAHIVNVSLWETIRRSLATTFITLLPVSARFFFGGETLKDFAFALLVGIGFSAFSTIFIAAPLLAVLKERSRSSPVDARTRLVSGGVGRRPARGRGARGRRARPGLSRLALSRATAVTAATATMAYRRLRARSQRASGGGSGGGRARMAADSDGSVVLRQLVEELSAQLRAGLDRLGDLPQETGDRVARELGLVTREEWDALELRLAQVEHRLRLLEKN